MRILVVDDEKIKRVTLTDDLAAQGHEVVAAADGQEAVDRLAEGRFDVVLTDLKMPRIDGLELLKRIKQSQPADTEVVMMTAYGSIPVAVEAVKLGALDFLTKPFRNEDVLPLLARIERQLQETAPPKMAEPTGPIEDMSDIVVGHSAVMEQVRRMVEIAAKTNANVLLHGETGVGKDLLATTIHRNSYRRREPFVKVGCTLFPPQLIESELYGHERGSFTGADQQRRGRFELAEKGTLYLDDVDDIPIGQQPKLLRAIEEKVYERVGGGSLIKADVRIVASTKQNLLARISEGTFRKDLYYRLDVLRINVPPLRERLEDVPLLVERLLKRIAGDRVYRIDDEAVAMLSRHTWPGNVRELYNTLERALLIGEGEITPDALAGQIGDPDSERSAPPSGFHAAIDCAEKQLLQDALRAADGNKTAAAASLGMKPSTFRDKLAKHGLS